MENEAQCVQDLKNEKANDTISSVTEYLVTHHGSPATVESLAKTRPFLESYIAMSFAAIKGHRSTMNSVSSMKELHQRSSNLEDSQWRIDSQLSGSNHWNSPSAGCLRHLSVPEEPDTRKTVRDTERQNSKPA